MLTTLAPMALVLATAFPADRAEPLDQQPQNPQQQEKPEEKKKGGAGEQMRRYVDEHAPKLAGWLFDSPRDSASYDGEPLRSRGLRSLPPAAETGFLATRDVTVLDDLGIVIAGAEPRIVYISSVMPSGSGAQADVRPNDVILTLNGQSIQTPQAFKYRYGRLPHGQPVELGLRRGSRRLTVVFYKPSRERTPERTTPPPHHHAGGSIIPD